MEQFDLFAEAGISPAWRDPASSGYIKASRARGGVVRQEVARVVGNEADVEACAV